MLNKNQFERLIKIFETEVTSKNESKKVKPSLEIPNGHVHNLISRLLIHVNVDDSENRTKKIHPTKCSNEFLNKSSPFKIEDSPKTYFQNKGSTEKGKKDFNKMKTVENVFQKQKLNKFISSNTANRKEEENNDKTKITFGNTSDSDKTTNTLIIANDDVKHFKNDISKSNTDEKKILISSVNGFENEEPVSDLSSSNTSHFLPEMTESENKSTDNEIIQLSDNLGPTPVAEADGIAEKIEKIKCDQKLRINELIRTEKTYVEQLRHVVRYYFPALKDDAAPLILSLLKPEDVFSNIKKIFKFHSLELLPALIKAGDDMNAIGNVFIQNANKFLIYEEYLSNKSKCNEVINKHIAFFDMKCEEFGDEFDILTYLTYPLQRFTRYQLFLETLIKNCRRLNELSEETNEDDLISLETGLNKLVGILNEVNVQMMLRNIKHSEIPLDQQGKFIRHDNFDVTNHLIHRKMKCFLFENCFMLTGLSKKESELDIFKYYDSIPMEHLAVMASSKDGTGFTIQHHENINKKYILKADSTTRKLWESDISRLLWNQLEKIRENARNSASNTCPEIQSGSSNATQTEGIGVLGSTDGKLNDTETASSTEKEEFGDEASDLEEIVNNILIQEEEYIFKLKQLTEYFQWEDSKFNTVTEEILNNTIDLYNFHSRDFWPALQKAHFNLSSLADVFIKNARHFSLYNQFSTKVPGGRDIVNRHKYLCELLCSKLGNMSELSIYFKDPFRMIIEYCRNLDRLKGLSIENLPSDFPGSARNHPGDIHKLKAAKMFLEILTNNIELQSVLELIRNSKVDLIANGKMLKNHEFTVSDSQGEKSAMRCFLFEKVFIMTRVEDSSKLLPFVDAINTKTLCFIMQEDSIKLWCAESMEKSYTLSTNSYILEEWFKLLSNQITIY